MTTNEASVGGFIAAILGVGIAVERFYEVVVIFVEALREGNYEQGQDSTQIEEKRKGKGKEERKERDSPCYIKFKTAISVIKCCLIGVGLTFASNFTLLSTIGLDVSSWIDKLISGLLGGCIAPYVHQIITLGFKAHQFLGEAIISKQSSNTPTSGGWDSVRSAGASDIVFEGMNESATVPQGNEEAL